jgi:hypothetical protein
MEALKNRKTSCVENQATIPRPHNPQPKHYIGLKNVLKYILQIIRKHLWQFYKFLKL